MIETFKIASFAAGELWPSTDGQRFVFDADRFARPT